MEPIVFDHVSKLYQIGVKHDRVGDVLSHWWRNVREGRRTTGDFWALRDISFRVPKGGSLGIVGHNGAGKSTVLKLASRITRPTSGTVSVRGRVAALIELGAGFHPDLTGRENVYLNGSILGMKRREIAGQFDSIVDFAELEQFIDTPVKRYSSGMALRLGFAVAAHLDPEVMLIDEVLSVGDMAFQRKCLHRIKQLRQRGVTILFISHNLPSVEAICDSVVLLVRGQEVMRGPAPEVLEQYRKLQLEHEQQETAKRAAANGAAGRQPKLDGELVDGVLTDPLGHARDQFQSGEPARLTVRYQIRRRLERPVVVASIERIDGVLCHSVTSPVELVEGDGSTGEAIVMLEYESLALGPGSYRVNIDLLEREGRFPVDRLERAAVFTVPANGVQRGVVKLGCRWFRTDQTLMLNGGHKTQDTGSTVS